MIFGKNIFYFFGLSLVIVVVSITGCSLPVTRLDVTHHSITDNENKKQGKILVAMFVDKREEENRDMIGKRVGLRKGGSLDLFLTNFFAQALIAAGYSTVIQDSQPIDLKPAAYDAVITGEIKKFRVDFSPGQVSHHVDVTVKALNPENQSVVWEKQIVAEQTNVNWVGARGEYSKVIDEALTKALNQAASAFASDEFSRAIKR